MSELYREARLVRKGIRMYGGSFMQALGNAMDYADSNNLARICVTWNDEWQQYLKMGSVAESRESRDENHNDEM